MAKPSTFNDVSLPKATLNRPPSQIAQKANRVKTRRTGDMFYPGSTHQVLYGTNIRDQAARELQGLFHKRHGQLQPDQALPYLGPEALSPSQSIHCSKMGQVGTVDLDVEKAINDLLQRDTQYR